MKTVRFAITILTALSLTLSPCFMASAVTFFQVKGTVTQDGTPVGEGYPVLIKNQTRTGLEATVKTDADGKYIKSWFNTSGLSLEDGDTIAVTVKSKDGTEELKTKTAIYEGSSPLVINVKIEEVVGDVSGDGRVTAYDASLILQFVVGLITEFPVESMMSSSPNDIEPRDYEISIPDVTVKPGEKVYVPIVVNDPTSLQTGGIVVKYDSSILKAIDTMATSTLSNSYWECNIEVDDEIRFAFASMKPIESGDRLILLEFEAFPDMEGVTSPLTLDYVNLSESLSITKNNGSVTVLPSRSMLLQNYPNPFNPETWIPFHLSDDAAVVISIYDVGGHLIRKIGLGDMPAGVYVRKDNAAYWDGCNNAGERVSSGVYFYSLQAGGYSATKRMLIIK